MVDGRRKGPAHWRWRSDRKGAMELPMRLMVTMIMAAMIISILYETVDVYSQNSAEQDLARQLNAISVKIQQVRSGADGTALRCDVILPQRTAYVRIGGALTDVSSFMIKYQIIGMSEKSIILEGIRLTGRPDGSGSMLLSGPGAQSLLLTYHAPFLGAGPEYVVFSR